MKKFIEIELDHAHLMRAGDILIHCIWIEKIMLDLIILKKHPKIIKKINKPSPYKIPATMTKERLKYWKKDFWEIKKEFLELFKPNEDIIKKIERINIIRNILSHSNVKLGQKYFLYRPKNRKKLTEAEKVFNLKKTPNQYIPTVLKIDYFNEENYFQDFKIIQSLDQEYFSNVAKKLNIIYSHLR